MYDGDDEEKMSIEQVYSIMYFGSAPLLIIMVDDI